jgi:lambda family phage portal protein
LKPGRLDALISAVSPGWAASRERSRLRALAFRQAYEAAETTHLRRQQRDFGSANAIVSRTGVALRNHGRHLDRNHDIISGGLSTLAQNIIGPTGINVVPTPCDADGKVVEAVVDQLMPLYADWSKRPEVTWTHDWASSQRLLARTWLRDGEAMAQELRGFVPFLDHGTIVPFSLELLEPDIFPLDLDDPARRILQAIERTAWNRPVAYHAYKTHPGDADGAFAHDTKRIPADLIRHLRLVDRIGQMRGISLLASTFTRIEDLKDYEESERIAAKIAASFAAVIIKGDPTMYPETGSGGDRAMRMQAGMIFDNLRPGEDVKTIDSKRPNPNLEPYRNAQLRAICSPMRISFSSFAKNYNGTYSAQRQELVEQYGAYGVLAYEFVSQMLRPVYERFVSIAIASGELILPKGMTPAMAVSADYLPPPMPWIDPVREVTGLRAQVRAGFRSAGSVIAERGGRMYDTFEAIQRERAWADNLGIVLDTDPRQVSAAGLTQARAPGSELPDLDTTPSTEESQEVAQ